MGIIYRTRQFLFTWIATPDSLDLQQAEILLKPELMELFLKMQPSEQVHSLKVMKQLIVCGQTHPDLLTAALLHDVGKICFALRTSERVLIVISKALFPKLTQLWGQGEPQGWKRAFVVAENHPIWGAELAEQAGATSLAVYLILHHQDKGKNTINEKSVSLTEHLLQHLKRFDNQN
jgi:hypothetical protein